MENASRREFLLTASAAALAAAKPGFATNMPTAFPPPPHRRVFVGTGSPDGILAFDFETATGKLTPSGVAAKVGNAGWVAYSIGLKYVFAALATDSFNGKATGAVASFLVQGPRLNQLSAQNSAGAGTCHLALDYTGRALISADYNGGSAASYRVAEGKLSPAVWSEHYTAHGPNADRQQTAHAHFVSFSPDNRFVYINDLGGDSIHIYNLDSGTAAMTPAGTYHVKPGAGPRTLHFHPNRHTAYSVNELDSTVDVLEWRDSDGKLTLVTSIELLPKGTSGTNRACDSAISRYGKYVYFANRGDDFLYSFRIEPKSGALTPMSRSSCGGKTPRHLTLDPSERWLLVANQDSNQISIFARNPATGVLAEEGKSVAAATPMCILFD